jgi:hypothetical protein
MANKNDYHWTFGERAHIRFPAGGDPVVDSPHAFSSLEGCATMSDGNGNLLFYTDGTRLYNAANVAINASPAPTLGGTSSSTHAAIIVPPAGGGSLYHIFATADWDGVGNPNVGPLTYTAVAAAAGVTIAAGPTKLTTFGPQRATERLAAVPHKDCNKYWVVSLNLALAQAGSAAATIFAMRIDSDAGPTAANTVSQPYPYPLVKTGYCVKFSPDGSLLAISSMDRVDILNFDRATGAFTAHSQVINASGANTGYGVEFSPNGLYLYLSGINAGYVNRHTIGASGSPPTAFSATTQIGQWVPTAPTPGSYRVGALQLGPNGKIYGAKIAQNTLLEIGDPNNALATAAAVKFKLKATTVGGGDLNLNTIGLLGLPTFTRVTQDCGDRCRNVAAAVDAALAGRHVQNAMLTSAGEPVGEAGCRPLELPQIAPWTSISWGSSRCDCIEGDDTEIMHLTVCNPYSNVTLANLTVHQLIVVDEFGKPVGTLPDGSPAIELVPAGPYCFDDLAPCSCATREFVLRLRGAIGGLYRILVRGICFDVCIHGDTEACFQFNVCKD